MIVDPELAALRCNDAPQRRDQLQLTAAFSDWRKMAGAPAVALDLARFAQGAALKELPDLSALFARDAGRGHDLTASLIGALLPVLGRSPLGQVPLRHFCDDAIAMVMLARHGTASLVVQAVSGPRLSRRDSPGSVRFAPGECWEHVLAGTGQGRIITGDGDLRERISLHSVPESLGPGEVRHRDSGRQALILDQVQGALVSLRLQRGDPFGGPAREYRLDDGALIHQAASTARESRLELAAALLGRMGRGDAAPVLADMARNESSAALRWQAMRECLALDTAAGFAALCHIAADESDTLARPAGILRAQLLESYPQLAQLHHKEPACLA